MILTITVIGIAILGGLLYDSLQQRIGEQQNYDRESFVKNNPHLNDFFNHSAMYQPHVGKVSAKTEKPNVGGMTDIQKKSS